ncbi:MAG: stage II sporulation protein M [Alphaproteobacteria bacterium]|nr:stage II sporulation protein M [Alphaproteobacteria bacterium]MBU1514439.1 stage II sporulation protein M [Alphaproteobacteria bacterium]MBU2097080.1 stage II sporulation protein M [Alphaproteobacteria bacterium]MBU2153559.1 stage II sporulation protein M [Alphaproteobacteria bacterium]MBU2308638.1 stage II sporulation protein M [Alphaproteobacteria bacterium]
MAELHLKSWRFRAEREADWRRLETLLAKAEAGGAAKLKRDELLEIPVLYRQALSSLSVARSISLDQSLTAYLESLCTRAYFIVYGARTRLPERMAAFFLRDWPAAIQSLWRETLVSFVLSAVAAVVAYVLVRRDADWFHSFVEPGLASGRDPTATTASLRDTLYHEGTASEGLSVFATFLFTHNAQIALFAFALGFLLCLPTAALLVMNGGMFGAFLALFVTRGLGFEAGGWLMIHGTTELFAIILAGAAGFSIGWSVCFPGDRSRIDAAAEAGRRAATAMMGVVVMLFVAGLLEGFGRQLIQADYARYAIAVVMLLAWLAYFYWPRTRRP